ncbi:MAG: radical SAM protein [Chloroflexi bacterium]|nr:radical SAM protein [Chloroflexota bacterium]
MRLKRLLNFAGDRLHTLPLLVMYLTDGCNSRCVTCDIWRNPRRNMRLELVEELAAAFEELQIRWVLLSGGEAMQHPHWPQIAQRLRAAGAHVMLLTNGLLLRKQIDAVRDSVHEVIVSLDGGTAATYQAIRGVDAFDLVLEGVRAVRAAGLPVTTRTTVQRANFREIPQIIDAGLAADVSALSFLAVDVSSEFAFGQRPGAGEQAANQTQRLDIPIVNNGASQMLTPGEVDELARLIDEVEQRYAGAFAAGRIAESPEKLRRILVSYFRALTGQGALVAPRCNAPHFSTVIEVDGTLRPCYFLPAYGKFRSGDTLAGALNVPAAVALRQAYRTGQRPECARCVCPLYKSPRALLEM